jgi:hypothetical protein
MNTNQAIRTFEQAERQRGQWTPVPGYPTLKIKITLEHWYIGDRQGWNRFHRHEDAVMELQRITQ